MLRPFLLVGVGGSGGKTLRVIREELEHRLKQVMWDDAFPTGWQFLQIDVATHPDGNEPDLPPQLPIDKFLGLVGAGIDYKTMDRALNQPLKRDQQLRSLAGWLPEPHRVSIPISKGAGQYRALGRVVTLTRLEEIRRRISQCIDALNDPNVGEQLARAAKAMNKGVNGTNRPDPVVVVVTSIAGGSGAGAFLDICDLLRERSEGAKWLDESVGLMYAPDVFDELPEAARRGVRPNALATMSELLNGYWKRGTQDSGLGLSEDVFAARGANTSTVEASGPRYPILVGARNSEVSYGNQNDIYKGMGKAIAAWVLDPRLQDRMQAHVFGNWAQAASTVPDRLGLNLTGQETPFTALGFARVSLGRDTFERYAVARLARLAIDDLMSIGRTPGDDRDDDEVVDSRVNELWGHFVRGTGLDERGDEANQIVDSLRDEAEWQQWCRDWAIQDLPKITSGAPAEGLSADDWRRRIDHQVQQGVGRQWLRRYAENRRNRTDDWVETIQVGLADHVTKVSARAGLRVTSKLLERLESELEKVAGELPGEATVLRTHASREMDQIAERLGRLGGRIPAKRDVLLPVWQLAADAVRLEAEADHREWVASLARSIRIGLVAPMRASVSAAHESLAIAVRPRHGEDSAIQHWPVANEVPQTYAAAKNEFLLDDIAKFPENFVEQVGKSVKDTRKRGVLKVAAEEVITAADAAAGSTARDDLPSPLRREQSWWPEMLDSGTPNKAQFVMDVQPKELLERSEAWVGDPTRSIGRYVTTTLKEHLTDEHATPAEIDRRLDRFVGQLRGGINRAQPLVNISRTLLSAVHDRMQPKTSVIISPVPLSESSDPAQRALKVLIESGAIDATDTDIFGDGGGSQIDIYCLLDEPYQPVVFSSLMEPISSEWSKVCQNDDMRQAFWRWRRSRPLPDAVPVSSVVLRSMVRGWFSAAILEQLQVDEFDGRASIWMPRAGQTAGSWGDFPSPALRPMTSPADAVGAVLESLTLALVQVYASASLDPLAPYRRLRDLGESGAHGIESYEKLGIELDRWIQSGTVTAGAPIPQRIGLPGSQGDAKHRKLEVLSRLRTMQDNYSGRFQELRVDALPSSAPRDLEMEDVIISALKDLERAANAVSTDVQGGFL